MYIGVIPGNTFITVTVQIFYRQLLLKLLRFLCVKFIAYKKINISAKRTLPGSVTVILYKLLEYLEKDSLKG